MSIEFRHGDRVLVRNRVRDDWLAGSYVEYDLEAAYKHAVRIDLAPSFTYWKYCKLNANKVTKKESVENGIVDALNYYSSPSKTQPGEAMRFNEGKPQYSYVDLKCLEPCARVLEYGATKYERNNWKKGMPVSKILDSLMRHIRDLQDGVYIDEESQQLVIGHIQANALFLGNINNTQDIRVFKLVDDTSAE